MSKKRSETSDRFTETQLAELRNAALASGFQAFTNDEGRAIYLDEDALGPLGSLALLMFDSECVWLDRYVRNADESIKAEADGSASTITELITTMISSPTMRGLTENSFTEEKEPR